MPKLSWKPGNMLYPVPAVMVTVADGKGGSNIITVAWAGIVCTAPPMVSISIRPQRYSYGMLVETGEFVMNMPTAALAKATDLCGVKSGRDTDKWAAAGLTPVGAGTVSAPLIAECPVNIECRVVDRRPLGSHDLFLAEVTAVNVDDALVDPTGRLELGLADLIAYVHGEYWTLGRPLGHFGFSVRKRKGSVVRTKTRPKTKR